MIVLDSSAVLGVLFQEQAAQRLVDAMEGATSLVMSAANVLECTLRLAPRAGLDETAKLDAMLRLYEVEIRTVDLTQLRVAREAFLSFGKGRHPAGLNFGDCFAYALARTLDAPLLFIGDDFPRTDIIAA